MQVGPPTIEDALLVGDFAGAWTRATTEPDGVVRSRACSQILYRAGDPSGALAVARDGLGSAPDDPYLLSYAVGSAIWLQEALLARRYSRRLRDAVELASFDPIEVDAWRRVVEDFDVKCEALSLHDEELTNAVKRSKLVVCVFLSFALLFASWFSVRGYGRSSSPDS